MPRAGVESATRSLGQCPSPSTCAAARTSATSTASAVEGMCGAKALPRPATPNAPHADGSIANPHAAIGATPEAKLPAIVITGVIRVWRPVVVEIRRCEAVGHDRTAVETTVTLPPISTPALPIATACNIAAGRWPAPPPSPAHADRWPATSSLRGAHQRPTAPTASTADCGAATAATATSPSRGAATAPAPAATAPLLCDGQCGNSGSQDQSCSDR
jgi:hypothetical protein